MSKGLIFNIQPFSLHDGPGTRTTVFMKGCNLRCPWCHNPESWHMAPEIMFYESRCIGCGACASVCPSGKSSGARFTDECTACGECANNCFADALQLSGEWMDAEDLSAQLLSDKDIYIQSGGGVTFSGGEPLLQTEFLLDVLPILKAHGIHIAVETAMCLSWEKVEPVIELADLIFCDIKHMNAEKHKEATKVSNELILENIRRVSKKGKTMCLRTPIIPGFNDSEEDIAEIAAFIASLPNRHEAELLAFHSMCSGKYAALHRVFGAKDIKEPGRNQMERLTQVVRERGVSVLYRM